LDAFAAFDDIIVGLALVACQQVGPPHTAGLFMHYLQKMRFPLITGFGKSMASFSNDEDLPKIRQKVLAWGRHYFHEPSI